ncbi:MAG: hypothetical protein GWP06_14730 [Actinobacteria bacterium]|nr:hypothetical protein [Actinomycetota bacterium]
MSINKYFIFFFVFLVSLSPFANAADEMYVMPLSANWEMEGDLPVHAFLISLQGVANLDAPHLYFIYPPKWDFKFSQPLLDYYKNTRKMQFRKLKDADEALAALGKYVKGYVVWDKNVRTSLIVAFTAAGLDESVVVSEDLIPLGRKIWPENERRPARKIYRSERL